MKSIFKTALAVAAVALATQAAAQITFYEHDGFQGRSFATQRRVGDFQRVGFNDLASSVVVVGERWEVCEHSRMDGRCMVLRAGRYPSLTAVGLNDNISSARLLPRDEQIAEDRLVPMPENRRDFSRRRDERMYTADVTSVRAVVGTPGQRCWIEREQVGQNPPQNQGSNAALVGAVLSILGHQQPGAAQQTQDVRRCDGNPQQATPDHWDVTYKFRGQEHRVQMSRPPGPTITVNRHGEPRA